MSKLEWDKSGEHLYETGVKFGVLYPYDKNATVKTKAYGPGVAWNGLSTVTESPSGAEESAIYADNIKYLSLRSIEELGLTIEAYTYPDAFAECDGSANAGISGLSLGQQTRKMFGLCYRTEIGNDEDGDAHGYKLHLVYGCTAAPSEKAYQTINDSPEAITFSWEVSTNPVNVASITIDGETVDFKPTSIVTVDSTKFATESTKALLTALEAKLYGTDGSGSDTGTDPYLPLPDEVITTLSA